MFEQTKLRDLTWACRNSRVDCPAVLPCFDAGGDVKLLLVITEQWGWLVSPPGRLTRDARDLKFAGPLEDLFKLTAQAIDRLTGLYHFDPDWFARNADLDAKVREVVLRTNLAGACLGRLPISEVVYDDSLAHVLRMEAGAALWRRQISAAAVKQFLQAGPTFGVGDAGGGGELGPAVGAGVCEPRLADRDALYQGSPTGGPLKLIAPAFRVGGGRSTIGKPTPPGKSGLKSATPSKAVLQPHSPSRVEGPPISGQPTRPPAQVEAPPPPVQAVSASRNSVAATSGPVARGQQVTQAPVANSEPMVFHEQVPPHEPLGSSREFVIIPSKDPQDIPEYRVSPVDGARSSPPASPAGRSAPRQGQGRPAENRPHQPQPPPPRPATNSGRTPPPPPRSTGRPNLPTPPPPPPSRAPADPVQRAIENIRRRLGK